MEFKIGDRISIHPKLSVWPGEEPDSNRALGVIKDIVYPHFYVERDDGRKGIGPSRTWLVGMPHLLQIDGEPSCRLVDEQVIDREAYEAFMRDL